MTRYAHMLAVALALAGTTRVSVAQMRSGLPAGPPASAGTEVRQPPLPGGTRGNRQFASRLTFVPPPQDPGQVPFPFFGFRWELFDFLPFWTWSFATPPRTSNVSAAAAVPLAASAPVGGLQLDVQPWRAQVYVDGAYVGLVEDFRGYYRHLDLAAGPHLIGIAAPGYRPLIIEVMIDPGHTVTYRGTLTRSESR